MKAIILVGGEGLRLRPLTSKIPKPMVPVANKPFLEHLIDNLAKHGIRDVILATCYLPDQIQRHFGDGSSRGIRLGYSVEEIPLGTAGAVKNAEEHLTETFLVLNGDIFSDLDFTAMIDFHRRNKAKATIALTPVEDPTAYGVVEIDERDRVKAFIEKPSWENVRSNLINAGTYVLEPDLLEFIPAATHSMIERGLFPDIVGRGLPFVAFRSNAYWIDIGKPGDYLRLNHDILMGKAMARFPGKSIGDDLWIEEGCKIHPTARLVGPSIVGRNCIIEQDVRVTGPAVIGDQCKIGQGTTLDEAVLWQKVTLGHSVTVRNSVLGNGAIVNDETWITDGSIVGDNVSIGRNNRIERGLKVWPDSRIEDNSLSF